MEKSSLPGSNFYISWNTETQPQVLLTTHKERSICGSSCSSPGLCIQPAAPSSMVFFSGPFTSTQRTRGATSGHFCVFWSSVTNLRRQPTWLKAIRGRINWTQSCNGKFWLMRRDSSIWDIWWVYYPRRPSYPSFHSFVSYGANQLLNHWSLTHTVW